MATNTQSVFLSYSRDDSEFVLQLAKDLRAASAKVWIDQQSIAPGQDWDNAIEDALIQCTHMVPILSPSSVKSRNVRNEIEFAFGERKSIIPVLYKDCVVPLQLRRVQQIDFQADYACSLDVLLTSLGVGRTVPAQQIAAPAAELPPVASPTRPKPQRGSAIPETSTVSFDSAEANALSGYIKKPLHAFIRPQASVTLPPSGGFLTQRVESFRFENILSCSSCSSQASSSENDETGKRSVLVSTTIEGLNVLEVLTANKIVAQIFIEQQDEELKPAVSFIGTRFENFWIAGKPFDIDLDITLARDAKPDPASLVREIGGGLWEARIIHNVIEVPAFGKISLANLITDFDSVQLTMIQVLFSGALQGNIAVAACRAGINRT